MKPIKENSPANDGLVLCAATVLQADFQSRVKAAKSAGYTAISLFPEQYLNARYRQKLGVGDMQHILQDHGIRVATIDPLLDWFGPSESQAEQLMYEAAEALGAPAINIAPAFGPNISGEETTEALIRLCERAEKHGLKVDVEFLPWSIIPDLPSLLEIVEASGRDNAFVTLDCLHFYRSGSVPGDLESLSARDLGRISNIQICDVAATPPALNWRQGLAANKIMLSSGLNGIRTMGFKNMLDVAGKAHSTREDAAFLMKEASCSRLLPGQGDIPVREILQTLDRLDCQALLGLEIFSLELNKLSAESAAQQAMAAYRQLTA
ncbi:MAG: sugar phosphate isomerase/epimerase family protein [Halioglobus sp.]